MPWLPKPFINMAQSVSIKNGCEYMHAIYPIQKYVHVTSAFLDFQKLYEIG